MDIESLNLSSDIKNRAHDIAKRVTTVRNRSISHKRLIFFCVLSAYSELNRPKDPMVLADEIGLSHDQVTKARRHYQRKDSSYIPPVTITRPHDFIEQYFSLFDMNHSNIERCIEECKGIENSNKKLKEYNPSYVAIGIIYMFFIVNGYKITMSHFCNTVNVSEVTLRKYYNIVSDGYL
jgi:transcription initiation factor TFIIIB Brf1 subunit/transcription initiation factor TFIIB